MSREDKQENGFLSRWSRRKLDSAEETPEAAADEIQDATPAATQETRQQEPEPEQERPLWQRDDVDADTKKAALRSLFRKPQFHVRDGLNEYDDDFTQFASLGNIVTHEMKRMLKLAEEKTRPKDVEADSTTESADSDKQADSEPKDNERT